ncbi:hypothetical protein CATRI_09155 [Corynebacterium atrinae]|uniref:DUF1707 SHOCT-like domain-containing protein n=1 Tax=Corynebacterium atrinae TaxID=1336740 RepID=UPI0025B4AD0B|nr:DUF1707 domain-containing protein [Corynebacterium atrinae]WJY63901.1 hypothetical protein CATRI_09155 [Corynebacterium atrinae]
MSRPIPPRDADREDLQANLTRLVGAGRLTIAEFDEIMDVVWSTNDKAVLDQIRARYFTYQGPPVPMSQPGQVVQPPQAPSSQPVSSTMGTIRRTGQWTVPAHSVFKLTGSSMYLDLRQAQATSPVCTFDINATGSSIEVIVPPGVYVENRLRDFLSSVDVQTTSPAPGAPRVILTGRVKGSSVTVVTRNAQGPGLWQRIMGG